MGAPGCRIGAGADSLGLQCVYRKKIAHFVRDYAIEVLLDGQRINGANRALRHVKSYVSKIGTGVVIGVLQADIVRGFTIIFA
ncbi:hypothetical protein SDC9_125317 [bioreactor metagenome]|uniref:Uncharacterized protein n=1 Tax=bioreactor metagenome TaxID=1076179 RepID=A0A645CMQ2_9ZZZZ